MVNVSLLKINETKYSEAAPPWVGTLEMIYLVVIVTLGIPGNGLIIFVQLKNKNKSSTDCLVLTMAVFDFVRSSFDAVIHIFRNMEFIWKIIASTCLCKVFLFTSYTTGGSSTLLVAGIAVDRYIKTCRPMNIFCTTKHAKYVCFCLSITCVITALPTFSFFYLDSSMMCMASIETLYAQKIWNKTLVSITIVVFVIVSFCYLSVSLSLRKRYREHRKAKSEILSTTPKEQVKHSTRCNKILPTNKKCNNRTTGIYTVSEPTLSYLQIQASYKIHPTAGSNSDSTGSKKTDVNKSNSEFPHPIKHTKRTLTMQRRLALQEKTMNKTTFIMFLISVIYMTTNAFNWSVFLIDVNSELSLIIRTLSPSIIMINSVTNPIFFFCMSSKFRANARKLLCKK